VRAGVVVASTAAHSAWQIAISETQRSAIAAAAALGDARAGLAVARQVAMVSYRSPAAYDRKFGRAVGTSGKNAATSPSRPAPSAPRSSPPSSSPSSSPSSASSLASSSTSSLSSSPSSSKSPVPPPAFDVVSYLDYQGEKFLDRFDPLSYVAMTHQMDRFVLSVYLSRVCLSNELSAPDHCM
jgi:homoserine O-acetyltransferase